MSKSAIAEIYFIAAMMIFTLILSGFACFFFFRTYKKEKAQHRQERENKIKEKTEKEYVEK